MHSIRLERNIVSAKQLDPFNGDPLGCYCMALLSLSTSVYRWVTSGIVVALFKVALDSVLSLHTAFAKIKDYPGRRLLWIQPLNPIALILGAIFSCRNCLPCTYHCNPSTFTGPQETWSHVLCICHTLSSSAALLVGGSRSHKNCIL